MTNKEEFLDELFELLDEIFHFDIDAIASKEITRCENWFGPGGIADNALEEDWFCSSVWADLAFCKKADFEKWMTKADNEAEKGSIVAYLFSDIFPSKWLMSILPPRSFLIYIDYEKIPILNSRWLLFFGDVDHSLLQTRIKEKFSKEKKEKEDEEDSFKYQLEKVIVDMPGGLFCYYKSCDPDFRYLEPTPEEFEKHSSNFEIVKTTYK